MKFESMKDAAMAWVNEFDSIPQAVIEKLMTMEEIPEIVVPYVGASVTMIDGEHDGEEGEIVARADKEGARKGAFFIVRSLTTGERFLAEEDEFDMTDYRDVLPMWGTMWAFPYMDQDWAKDHIPDIVDCGFRVYEQEDYGLIIGIDGAGYDFYEDHWIPLYKARGLRWHERE